MANGFVYDKLPKSLLVRVNRGYAIHATFMFLFCILFRFVYFYSANLQVYMLSSR